MFDLNAVFKIKLISCAVAPEIVNFIGLGKISLAFEIKKSSDKNSLYLIKSEKYWNKNNVSIDALNFVITDSKDLIKNYVELFLKNVAYNNKRKRKDRADMEIKEPVILVVDDDKDIREVIQVFCLVKDIMS